MDKATLSAIPHIEQYFGLWAVEPTRFQAMIELVRGMDMKAHVAEALPLVSAGPIVLEGGVDAEFEPDGGFMRSGETAIISIAGVMTKYGSSMSSSGSTMRTRRQLATAMRSDKIKSIVLRIDSPGGSVAGTADLADDIAAANKKKPILAFIEDLGASAAYWVASAAGSIMVNQSAEVGSIGVFAVINDMSSLYAKEGVKVHVVKAGKFKGAGVQGTEITADQITEWQRMVDETYARFVGAVASGRGMTEDAVRALADGRVWGTADALSMGLIDKVGRLGEAIATSPHARKNIFYTAEAGISDRQENFTRSIRAENQRRSKAMNFSDAVKAVLDGTPDKASEDHRDIAIAAVAQVRAHDKAGHEKAIEAARAAGVEAAVAESKGRQSFGEAERARAVNIVMLGSKIGISGEAIAEHIKSDKKIEDIAVEAVAQAATTQKPLAAKRGYDASQPGDETEEQKAAADALKAASENVATSMK